MRIARTVMQPAVGEASNHFPPERCHKAPPVSLHFPSEPARVRLPIKPVRQADRATAAIVIPMATFCEPVVYRSTVRESPEESAVLPKRAEFDGWSLRHSTDQQDNYQWSLKDSSKTCTP